MKILNKKELAIFLKISVPTLDNWVARWEGFPVLVRGTNGTEWQFDVDAVSEFLEARRLEELQEQERKEQELREFAYNNPSLFAEMDQDTLGGLSAKEQLEHYKLREAKRKDALATGKLLIADDVRNSMMFAFSRLGAESRSFLKRVLRDNSIPEQIILHETREYNRLQHKIVSELVDELKIKKTPDDEKIDVSEDVLEEAPLNG